ncbi:MAG: hypothetical protein R3181_13360 [Rubricoccaceae bacterium]|nr:hypothetical protein [Rubricoccaceae bacterium]
MRALVVLLSLLALTGCSLLGLDGSDDTRRDVFRYTAYDDGDAVVVTGTLRIGGIPSASAEEPAPLVGSWTLVATSAEVGPQDGEGSLVGTYQDSVEGPLLSIDLHPENADDNVGLAGRLVDDGARIEGTWQHVGFAGPIAAGRFEAVRTASADR